jgi:hypothetical protein
MTELESEPNKLNLGERPAEIVRPRVPDPHQAEYDPVARYSDAETVAIRARQKSRSIVVGALLFGMCVMFFGITLAKIGYWG